MIFSSGIFPPASEMTPHTVTNWTCFIFLLCLVLGIERRNKQSRRVQVNGELFNPLNAYPTQVKKTLRREPRMLGRTASKVTKVTRIASTFRREVSTAGDTTTKVDDEVTRSDYLYTSWLQIRRLLFRLLFYLLP